MDRTERVAQIAAARAHLAARRLPDDATAVTLLQSDIKFLHMYGPEDAGIVYTPTDLQAISMLPIVRRRPDLMHALIQHPRLSPELVEELTAVYRLADTSPNRRAPGWAGVRLSDDHVHLLSVHPNLTLGGLVNIASIRGHAEDGIHAVITHNDDAWMTAYIDAIEQQVIHLIGEYLGVIVHGASRERRRNITNALPLTAIGLISLTTTLPPTQLQQLQTLAVYMVEHTVADTWTDRAMCIAMLLSPRHPFAANLDADTLTWLRTA